MTTIKNNISEKEIFNYLRLIRSPNVGASTFWRLINIFGNVENALYGVENFFERMSPKKKIKLISEEQIYQEIEQTYKFGGEIILASDYRFPKFLHYIDDCPPLLIIKGDASFLQNSKISIVGSRNCSFHGENIAKKIALEFGQNSFTTVSGLARGIDSAVHEASILGGTIAVIAGGINSIYPYENKRLYQQICEVGLLISEMPFNAPPKSNYFIRRNRIISGLSSSLIVVEASNRSGSLATARFALEQGREIFACAGSPFDQRCSGVNQLIKDGAGIITDLGSLIQDAQVIENNFQLSLISKNKSPKISFNEISHWQDYKINDNDFSSLDSEKLQQFLPSFENRESENIDSKGNQQQLNFNNSSLEINQELNDDKSFITATKSIEYTKSSQEVIIIGRVKNYFQDYQNDQNFSLQNINNKIANQYDFVDQNPPSIEKNKQLKIDKKNTIKNKKNDFVEDFQMQEIAENILAKLSSTPVEIDNIIQQLNIPARLINVALVNLELNGKISVNHGRVYGEVKSAYG